MIALLLVIAGFCVMFGARDAAGKLIRTAIALVVILSVIPALLACCGEQFRSLGVQFDGGEYVLGVLLALAIVGFIAWRTRSWRAARRETARRLHGAPRDRALPVPPPSDEDDR